MQKYGEVMENISNVLNSDYRTKEDKALFKECLIELKEKYEKEISTKFLKGLIIKDLKGKTKSHFIYDFIKSMKLKKRKVIREFSFWENQKLKVDLTEYAIGKDGNVFIKECIPQEIGKFAEEFYHEVLYFLRV